MLNKKIIVFSQKLLITILFVAIFASSLNVFFNFLIFKYKLQENWYYVRNTGNFLTFFQIYLLIFSIICYFYFYLKKLFKNKFGELKLSYDLIIAIFSTFLFYFIIFIIRHGVNHIINAFTSFTFAVFKQ
jgi:hypothetical protein